MFGHLGSILDVCIHMYRGGMAVLADNMHTNVHEVHQHYTGVHTLALVSATPFLDGDIRSSWLYIGCMHTCEEKALLHWHTNVRLYKVVCYTISCISGVGHTASYIVTGP